MANVSPVGDTPDDEFVSRAETAAQLAEQAAADAQQAAADAQAAAAAAQAAVDAQTFSDHADAAFGVEATNDLILYNGTAWANEPAANISVGIWDDIDLAGIANGQALAWDGNNLVPFTPVNPADFLLLAGGTMTGTLVLDGDPATALEAATKAYVDNQFAAQSPYDIGIYFDGAPGADEVLYRLLVNRGLALPINLTNSVADAAVAATAQTDVDIRKNGVSVGTVRWAAAATAATFIFASEVTFVSGDTLELVAPTTPDTTLASISITLAAQVQ